MRIPQARKCPPVDFLRHETMQVNRKQERKVNIGLRSRVRKFGFEPQLCYIQEVLPWATYFVCLCSSLVNWRWWYFNFLELLRGSDEIIEMV